MTKRRKKPDAPLALGVLWLSFVEEARAELLQLHQSPGAIDESPIGMATLVIEPSGKVWSSVSGAATTQLKSKRLSHPGRWGKPEVHVAFHR